jgi:nucleotide-binding universal stress UspA family protein
MSALNFNQALICLDISASDDALLEYLNFFKTHIPINSMYFMHVVKKPSFLSGIFGSNASSIHSQFMLDEDIVKHFINKVESKITGLEDINLEYQVLEGNPLNEILEQTEEHHADIVIMGKKPLSVSTGQLSRSVARRTDKAVLLIPDKVNNILETILIPIDFSENSGRALQKAIALNYSLKSPAKIICLHVYDLPDLSYYKINKTYEQLRQIVKNDMQEAFDKFLAKYASNVKDLIEIRSEERDQLSTSGQILAVVTEVGADLLIVGAKGHSKFESAFLGSVTEKLVQLNDSSATLIVR